MAELKKARVTLGNVSLAAVGSVAWRFTGGVQPYSAVFSVHKSKWSRLQGQIGKPLQLKIIDSRGEETAIEQVYILHVAPSDSPNRVSFVVADKRWRWGYKLVVRDFNMPRKTGDARVVNNGPVELQQVFDNYTFLEYSLQGTNPAVRWTAQACVEEVLEILEGEGTEAGGYTIESFPIKDTSGGNNTGEFTIQGVTLRDQGDMALARMLSYVPGADVYINAKGQAVVYDATDLDATEAHFQALPVSTWDGEHAAWVDRKHIRPSKVVVYYQRELEILLEYADDYRGFTSAQRSSSEPYIENVIPTVEPSTTINEYDPVSNSTKPKQVPPGTWVRVDKWLEAMDAVKPPAVRIPWNFDTIKRYWVVGDLEATLGARGLDFDPLANVAMRVQALRQHFRQTFRINRRYMERNRSLRAVRVGIVDPISGARAPAAVWGQCCIMPLNTGKFMATRGTGDNNKLKTYRNVDMLRPSDEGAEIVTTAPGPARVTILDEDLGIFRIDWIASPYGTADSFIPSKLVDEQNFDGFAVSRDLSQQDQQPMGHAIQIESSTNGVYLDSRMRCVVAMTFVPNAPNNARQFHKIEIEPNDIASLFRREFRIQDGAGPVLEVFVPPGEATARFAVSTQAEAFQTVQQLLGLNAGATGAEAGLEGPDLPGYTLTNEDSHLKGHAASLAAELLTPFADNVQGTVVTRVPTGGLKLVGNMSGATIRVAGAPSGKVDAVHQFPGQQRQISRLAVMPESTRQIVLGIVPFPA